MDMDRGVELIYGAMGVPLRGRSAGRAAGVHSLVVWWEGCTQRSRRRRPSRLGLRTARIPRQFEEVESEPGGDGYSDFSQSTRSRLTSSVRSCWTQ